MNYAISNLDNWYCCSFDLKWIVVNMFIYDSSYLWTRTDFVWYVLPNYAMNDLYGLPPLTSLKCKIYFGFNTHQFITLKTILIQEHACFPNLLYQNQTHNAQSNCKWSVRETNKIFDTSSSCKILQDDEAWP